MAPTLESIPRTRVADDVALAQTMAAFPEVEAGVVEPDHPFPTGETRFELGVVLGRGGMGTVYVARDGQFGRDVALKQMSAEVLSVEATRRFLVESLVTANLEHPGIPAVYERGVREGHPFYAMRKVEGRTLAEAVDKARGADERLRLLPAIVQVAHTLGFAHERGVVHRDVKPDNVVLGDHGETVLLDWGIARVHGASWSDDEGPTSTELQAAGTVAGAVLGTPAYMAPEQAAGRVEDIDERTDVFALGAMLFHVLSGAPPYIGETAMAVLTAALEGRRGSLKHSAPNAPPELIELVDIAMAGDPADRYPNAAAFADALQGFLSNAVTGRPSRAVRAFATASGIAVLLFAIFVTVAISGQISSFSEQGLGAYAFLALTSIGGLLSLIEWRTVGRHHLGPLTLVFAGITVLTGLMGTVTGAAAVVRQAATLPSAEVQAALLEGLWVAAGNLPAAANMASIQLVLWALARRATHLAAERAENPARGSS